MTAGAPNTASSTIGTWVPISPSWLMNAYCGTIRISLGSSSADNSSGSTQPSAGKAQARQRVTGRRRDAHRAGDGQRGRCTGCSGTAARTRVWAKMST